MLIILFRNLWIYFPDNLEINSSSSYIFLLCILAVGLCVLNFFESICHFFYITNDTLKNLNDIVQMVFRKSIGCCVVSIENTDQCVFWRIIETWSFKLYYAVIFLSFDVWMGLFFWEMLKHIFRGKVLRGSLSCPFPSVGFVKACSCKLDIC